MYNEIKMIEYAVDSRATYIQTTDNRPKYEQSVNNNFNPIQPVYFIPHYRDSILKPVYVDALSRNMV